MSRVESPFHAIAAEALDNNPDVPEAVVDAFVAAPVVTSSEVTTQERESVKTVFESSAGNGHDEAAAKSRSSELEAENTPAQHEQRVSFEGGAEVSEAVTKKSKKRTNVWTKTTSRKTAKKVKSTGVRANDAKDDSVLLKPFQQEDDPSYPILLSKIYKAEKIELSADRLTASGSKGYRMVRATRGVVEGAWYFEIYVDRLGDTGHTRLGWSTRRGDLQAPVGYDAHSYSYRDLDGCKVHAALREDYGDAYNEKDVIGFYINLPRESGFTWKPEEEVVGYKGHPYTIVADEPLDPLPGSEILFFKNGVCQGVAFKDVNDGAYFPAASMYTLPSQEACQIVFNFGPDFKYPVADFGDRPLPSPMCQASGPGEARMESVKAAQTEVGGDSTVNGGNKWMAPGHGDKMEIDEVPESRKEESAPKEAQKVLPVAPKKMKTSKSSGGSILAPHLPKPAKSDGLELHQGSKMVTSLKSHKKKISSVTTVTSTKSVKKKVSALGMPSLKGTGLEGVKVNERVLPIMGSQGFQENRQGAAIAGLPGSKGAKRDTPLPGLPRPKTIKHVLPGDKSVPNRSKDLTGTRPVPKASKKVLPGTVASRKDVHGTGRPLSNMMVLSGTGAGESSKKALGGAGSGHNPSKKGMSGSGSVLSPSRKDMPGSTSLLGPNRYDMPGPGPLVSRIKKDLPGTGSIHKPKKKAPNVSNYLPRGSSSTFSAGNRWTEGATMVDVVVVESSAPTQSEGL